MLAMSWLLSRMMSAFLHIDMYYFFWHADNAASRTRAQPSRRFERGRFQKTYQSTIGAGHTEFSRRHAGQLVKNLRRDDVPQVSRHLLTQRHTVRLGKGALHVRVHRWLI